MWGLRDKQQYTFQQQWAKGTKTLLDPTLFVYDICSFVTTKKKNKNLLCYKSFSYIALYGTKPKG